MDSLVCFLYFIEGALTAQKDVKLEKHHILNIPNLHVVMAMKSLKSMGHAREAFNWQWHYYFLTPSGVEYLRNFLHLPTEVVPATHKKTQIKTLGEERPRRFGDRKEGGDRPPRTGGRGEYRRGGEGRSPRPAAATE